MSEKTYFLLAPSVGLVKIGKSTNVLARVEALRTMNAVDVELLHVTRVPEAELHSKFAAHRKHGEWFHCNIEIGIWLADRGDEIAYDKIKLIGQDHNV